MVLDYLFGGGVSAAVPLDRLSFLVSKRTGRTGRVLLDGRLFGTMRSDGGVALTCFGAETLLRASTFRENCIVVGKEAEVFVAAGRSVFCKHVLKCGSNVRPGSDVALLSQDGRVLAVGKARLSGRMIECFKAGVAVKVRAGCGSDGVRKSSDKETS